MLDYVMRSDIWIGLLWTAVILLVCFVVVAARLLQVSDPYEVNLEEDYDDWHQGKDEDG